MNTWERALTDEQREKLEALRARHCKVEAVFVAADAAKGIEAHVRLSVMVDSLQLAFRNEAHDIRVGFDALCHDAMVKLTLPEPPRELLD
ncbi:hypothetical protein [Deinococcus yavapaiensis]|uniref:Uncharacterized protein n=1 Tax=Deinococcus yavapaiensis KR-236 TaxID=694435 RepID=A0A318S579_9DEIO|nr:hypothetical protein [Deinococcus yavapaiensis]PYE50973.1 hypothetical protein DES52_11640 [Deinococcus yavapaiensis KR-236]